MHSDSPSQHIFTISPSHSFVDVLAQTLLARAGDDPMALANMQLLLPTRRAIRAMREAFLRASGGTPILLPMMRPIGEVDEEAFDFAHWAEGVMAEDEAELPSSISSTERQMLLAKAILAYQQSQQDAGGASASLDQAVLLARDLAALLDEAAREAVPLSRLKEVVPVELAQHWQITLDFLQIITHHWPDILCERGLVDGAERRNLLLAKLATHWQAHPPQTPVIVAGTTGSSPATAALLKVIAGLPQGMVVLPGLDQGAPDKVWQHMGEDAAHPQYGLYHLLKQLECERQAVSALPEAEAANARVTLLNQALWPATISDLWQSERPENWLAGLKDMTLVQTATQEEEATAIALMLRDALETPARTAALITPNRVLARRVAATLQRFHVQIDDSAGMPLASTPPAIFLQLLAEVAATDAAPVPLLALLKHPLAQFGVSKTACRSMARLLEVELLRGVRLKSGFAVMRHQLEQPELQKRLSAKDRVRMPEFIAQVEAILAPLMALGEQSVETWLKTHMAVAEAAAGEEIWQSEAGEALAATLADLQVPSAVLGVVDLAGYPKLFGAFLAGKAHRASYGSHPRLAILSPMEARLQRFDRVVLAGLNEGEWPESLSQDPWMSRDMRRQMAFSLPERSVGLSAHDFMMQMAADEVFLTRSVKAEGAETVPSRWLMRLFAVVGILGGEKTLRPWQAAGEPWQRWAKQLDVPGAVHPCSAPEPRPEVRFRPRSLPVTDIEKLLRNPYEIFAKRVLGLKKLDPIDKEPGGADFGTGVHAVIEHYLRDEANGNLAKGEESAHFLALTQHYFADLLDRPALKAFWQPRFELIAEQFLAWHLPRRAEAERITPEQEIARQFDLPAGEFTLKARVDRTEMLSSGAVRYIDYKTGSLPSPKDIKRGLACQLLLEAVIGGMPVDELEYWPLKGQGGDVPIMKISEKIKDIELKDFINQTEQSFRDLMAAYDAPETPYRYAPDEADQSRYDDFMHLAREKEWRG